MKNRSPGWLVSGCFFSLFWATALSGCNSTSAAVDNGPAGPVRAPASPVDGAPSGGGESTAPGGGPGDSCPSPAPSAPPVAVCNPFGGEGSIGPNSGWIGRLWYKPHGFCGFYGVYDYETFGIEAGIPLYFDVLNVPTRKFREGFPTEDGSLIKDADGQPLHEHFALRLNSVIQLGPRQKPGLYQFAVLSDDGSVVRLGRDLNHAESDIEDLIESDSSEDRAVGKHLPVLIDNDGDHASRLACAHHAVRFDRDTRRPIQVDYFQGPRYDLSLILLWRKVPDHGFCPHDSACGREGNDEFFDPRHGSEPQPLWFQMLERGWRVVGPENFTLPPGTPANPCAPAPSPSPSVSPSPSPTPDPGTSPSPTPMPSASPSPTPTPSSSMSPTPDPGTSPSPTPTPSPSPDPSTSPSSAPTPSPSTSPTPAPSPSASPSPTPDPPGPS